MTARVTVAMPDDLLRHIDDRARRNGATRSRFVADSLRRSLKDGGLTAARPGRYLCGSCGTQDRSDHAPTCRFWRGS